MMSLLCILDDKWSPLQKDVADALIQRHVLRTSQGRVCAKGCTQRCRDIWCSCMVTRVCGLLTWLTFFISLIVVIVLGFTIVGPHFHSASYKVAQCHVTSVEDDQVIGCSCGKLCYSKTICAKVNVEYTREDGEKVHGLLHITEEGDGKCTADPPCFHSYRDNVHHIEKIVSNFPLLYSFKCLYDPAKGSTKVIEHHAFTQDGPIIHMLVWPLVMLVLAITAAIFICCTCGYEYACCDNPPQDVRIIATNLQIHGVYTLKSLPVEERNRLLSECAPEPEEEVQPQQIQRGQLPQPI